MPELTFRPTVTATVPTGTSGTSTTTIAPPRILRPPSVTGLSPIATISPERAAAHKSLLDSMNGPASPSPEPELKDETSYSTQRSEVAPEETPLYKNPWVIASVVFAIVATGGALYATRSK